EDNKGLPDYDTYSFNSGYAHKVSSHGRFIDFVAVHEREKNVVIVLNSTLIDPIRKKYSLQDYHARIFNSERLAFLQKWGFKSVVVKGEENRPIEMQTHSEQGRVFAVILRSSFSPVDMKWLQLASDRLLNTGDNTPAEAFAARCILYLYENVDDIVINSKTKTKFTAQQVAIAESIYPPLGELIRFGATLGELSQNDQARVIEILLDPAL